MTQQFTASEVRTESCKQGQLHRQPASDMLNAFADLLEAREKAVPVAYADAATREEILNVAMRKGGYGCEVPLFVHPAPSDADRLAEALRVFDGSFLKELADLVSFSEDDRGCINRSFVMERVVGLRRCWDKLSATRAHSAHAQKGVE